MDSSACAAPSTGSLVACFVHQYRVSPEAFATDDYGTFATYRLCALANHFVPLIGDVSCSQTWEQLTGYCPNSDAYSSFYIFALFGYAFFKLQKSSYNLSFLSHLLPTLHLKNNLLEPN